MSPLQLTTETGRPYDPARRKRARQWIATLESAFGHGSVIELQAIVPAGNGGVPLSALYLCILGKCLWGHGAVWELLHHVPTELQLSVTMSGMPPTIRLMPESRVKVLADLMPEMEKPADIEPVARLISEYWTGFCAKAAPWLAGGGLSKLVIFGTTAEPQSEEVR